MRYYVMLSLIFILFSACKKSRAPQQPAPVAAVLLQPADNAVCATGGDINDSTSSIEFQWQLSANTNYKVFIKNLQTGVAMLPITTANGYLLVNLPKGTPYSWYVQSFLDNSSLTASSNVWKFYSAGNGIVLYPPFPADLIYPSYGAAVSGTITLKWHGSSPSGATAFVYDVYLGNANPPAHQGGGFTDDSLPGIKVTQGATYYWYIITRDAAGNSSRSEIYRFSGQ